MPRRRKGLTSRSPLQANPLSPLVRRLPPQRRTAIAQVSAGRRRENRVRAQVKRDLVENRGGLCEIRWDDRCERVAVDADERRNRSQGGSIVDPANIQLGCRHCHRMKTENPTEAEQRGLRITGTQPAHDGED